MFDLPPARAATRAPVRRSAAAARCADRRRALRRAAGDRFHAPRTLRRAGRAARGAAAGAAARRLTDVGLWVNKQFRALGDIIYVGDVAELQAHRRVRDGALRIGAGASLEDAWRRWSQRCPALTDVWLRFASPPIRNAGTMGGNVANGSPIGDSAPVLIALDAQLRAAPRRAACARCRWTTSTSTT